VDRGANTRAKFVICSNDLIGATGQIVQILCDVVEENNLTNMRIGSTALAYRTIEKLACVVYSKISFFFTVHNLPIHFLLKPRDMRPFCRVLHFRSTTVSTDGLQKDAYGLVHFPSQPKIFPLTSITSNLSTHAWSIKCR
jgi:hypothetical protein